MQNTSTSRSTDFWRQKTITSKTPLTLCGRGFCASDRTPTTTGSPARPQSNQNAWVLPPISRNDWWFMAVYQVTRLHPENLAFCGRIQNLEHPQISHDGQVSQRALQLKKVSQRFTYPLWSVFEQISVAYVLIFWYLTWMGKWFEDFQVHRFFRKSSVIVG